MYLYGASGHARVIREILELGGAKVSAFVDDDKDKTELDGLVVRHEVSADEPLVIAIGDSLIRQRIARRLVGLEAKGDGGEAHALTYGTAIHPLAIVSPTAEIGEGTVVMPGAVINAYARIGRHCVINTGAVVDHECVIGDYVNVCPHTTLCGNVHVGDGSNVCAGSVVIQGITIGKWSMVGAGSVVVKHVPDGVVAFGNPCKVVHENENRPHE